MLVCATSAMGALGFAGAGEDPGPAIHALQPEADTYVTSKRPDSNFGHSSALRADASPQATTYLRFRLKSIKGEIASVTLLLHARSETRSSFEVREVRNVHWREGRLTYANAPRLSLRYASSKPVRRGAWSAVDVTSFVSNKAGTLSLAITTRSSVGVVFDSRESKHSPRLVIRAGAQRD